jgi:peptidoglycan/xylan/chitin deacetylase (PgdA/CDA1 family)
MLLKRTLDPWLATKMSRHNVSMRNQAPVVTFTFDDFPESAATVGARILRDHGALGTFYMAGGLLGRAPEGVRIASPEQVDELWQVGHEIGCHTFSHVSIDQLGSAGIEEELEANRASFSDGRHDRRLISFSYPFGLMSLAAKRVLSTRFASCRSIVPGIHAGKVDLACLRAIPLYDTQIDRAQIDWCMDRLLRCNGWIIFYTHDVVDRPTCYGCSPALLEYAVGRAQKLGVDVLTVRNAIGRVAFGGS